MTRYYKHKEDPNVSMHMRFYDRFGNLLENVIELDPEQYDGEPNAKRINSNTGEIEDCFYAEAIVEVDTQVNPSPDHMEAFRTLAKARYFTNLPHEERQAVIKDLVRASDKMRKIEETSATE